MNFDITLVGKRIRLRPLLEKDAKILIDVASDGELWDNPLTTVPSKNSVLEYINTALKGQAEKVMIPFVIEDIVSNKAIGCTRFYNIDSANRKLEIGYTWYRLTFQRTYANTEVKYLMLCYAFETLNYMRVQFLTDELNEKSRAAIARIGAKQEGIIRNDRIMPNGRIRNSVQFSIIDSEWSGAKIKLLEKLNRKYQ
jgi:RimJ/RimL family protein N-acetyltransferase